MSAVVSIGSGCVWRAVATLSCRWHPGCTRTSVPEYFMSYTYFLFDHGMIIVIRHRATSFAVWLLLTKCKQLSLFGNRQVFARRELRCSTLICVAVLFECIVGDAASHLGKWVARCQLISIGEGSHIGMHVGAWVAIRSTRGRWLSLHACVSECVDVCVSIRKQTRVIRIAGTCSWYKKYADTNGSVVGAGLLSKYQVDFLYSLKSFNCN